MDYKVTVGNLEYTNKTPWPPPVMVKHYDFYSSDFIFWKKIIIEHEGERYLLEGETITYHNRVEECSFSVYNNENPLLLYNSSGAPCHLVGKFSAKEDPESSNLVKICRKVFLEEGNNLKNDAIGYKFPDFKDELICFHMKNMPYGEKPSKTVNLIRTLSSCRGIKFHEEDSWWGWKKPFHPVSNLEVFLKKSRKFSDDELRGFLKQKSIEEYLNRESIYEIHDE